MSESFQRLLTRERFEKADKYEEVIRDHLLAEVARLDKTDIKAANRYLWSKDEKLRKARLRIAYDDDEIQRKAREYADTAMRCRGLENKEKFLRDVSIQPPSAKGKTEESRIRRMHEPRWWRGKIKESWTRSAENEKRDMGIIRKGKESYVSDACVKNRQAQRRRGREYLKSHVMENEDGEQLELLGLADRSLSNTGIRRGELMTRLKGLQEIASKLGHLCDFYTLTAPSAFHAELEAGGRNPRFQGFAPRDAHLWIRKMWARQRSFAKRKNIHVYGFRGVEPHHDGTPHWHVLVFGDVFALDLFRTSLQGIWLSEYGSEPGARQARTKVKRLDPALGDAVTYLAKYIAKNINADGTIGAAEDFETGKSISESIQRVDAWASVHRFRQFQSFGHPPIGIYREARRVREKTGNPEVDAAIEHTEKTERKSVDYAAFLEATGGLRNSILVLEKIQTGEIGRYGDVKAPQIIGIRSKSGLVKTRPHTWTIKKKGMQSGAGESASPSLDFSSLGPVALTVRSGNSAKAGSFGQGNVKNSRAGPDPPVR